MHSFSAEPRNPDRLVQQHANITDLRFFRKASACCMLQMSCGHLPNQRRLCIGCKPSCHIARLSTAFLLFGGQVLRHCEFSQIAFVCLTFEEEAETTHWTNCLRWPGSTKVKWRQHLLIWRHRKGRHVLEDDTPQQMWIQTTQKQRLTVSQSLLWGSFATSALVRKDRAPKSDSQEMGPLNDDCTGKCCCYYSR